MANSILRLFGLYLLFWLVSQNANCLIEFSNDFLKAWIGLLHNESSKVFGVSFLHLCGLHDIIITATIGVKPTDEQTTAKCLFSIASLANIKQDVRIGCEECFDNTKYRIF